MVMLADKAVSRPFNPFAPAAIDNRRPVGQPQKRDPLSRPVSPAPVSLAPVSLALRNLHANRPIVAAGGNRSRAYLAAKRMLDVIGVLGLLCLFSPIILTVLLVLTVTTKGRPLFVQRRVGFRGRCFPMIKFRTMRLDAERLRHEVSNEQSEGPIFKNRRDPRITRLGRILRKTSIDELPQLFNVLAGQMSLVGPRPPIVGEVEKYTAWQRDRLSIKPGLTCLWQVSGRSDIGFVDWVRMDLWYIRNQSLWNDLLLLVKTPLTVVMCRGAY